MGQQLEQILANNNAGLVLLAALVALETQDTNMV